MKKQQDLLLRIEIKRATLANHLPLNLLKKRKQERKAKMVKMVLKKRKTMMIFQRKRRIQTCLTLRWMMFVISCKISMTEEKKD